MQLRNAVIKSEPMHPQRVISVGMLLCALVAPVFSRCSGAEPQSASTGGACGSCHSEISNSYHKTAMANASGVATGNPTPGELQDKDSGVRDRVYQQDGKVWMNYAREGKDAIRGQRELLYFLGSGEKG